MKKPTEVKKLNLSESTLIKLNNDGYIYIYDLQKAMYSGKIIEDYDTKIYNQIYKALEDADWKFPENYMETPWVGKKIVEFLDNYKNERNITIYEDRRRGVTCRALAERYSITAGRIGDLDKGIERKIGRLIKVNTSDNTNSIDKLNLSVRSYNGLVRRGIRTIDDLKLGFESGDIWKARNLGKNSIAEIAQKLDVCEGTQYSKASRYSGKVLFQMDSGKSNPVFYKVEISDNERNIQTTCFVEYIDSKNIKVYYNTKSVAYDASVPISIVNQFRNKIKEIIK